MRERETRRANSRERRAVAFIDNNHIRRCSKLRYYSAELAWTSVGNAYLKGRDEKAVYYCVMCMGYHATSSESAFASSNSEQWKPGLLSHNGATRTSRKQNHAEFMVPAFSTSSEATGAILSAQRGAKGVRVASKRYSRANANNALYAPLARYLPRPLNEYLYMYSLICITITQGHPPRLLRNPPPDSRWSGASSLNSDWSKGAAALRWATGGGAGGKETAHHQ